MEDAAPEALRPSMFEALCMLAPSEDESFIRSSYDRADDGTYRLNAQGEERRKELDERIATPFALAFFAESASERAGTPSGDAFDLDALTAAYAQGAVTKDDVLAMADEALSAASGVDESLVAQQAVSAAKAEYEHLGYDMDSMQMRYLLGIGGRMLAVAALMTAAAVAVGYIASRTAAGVAKRLRERLFAKVLAFSDADVQKFSAASLITRATNDIQQIQMVVTVLLRMVLYAPILAIGGIVMVSRTDASMSWIIVVAVAAIFATVAVLMGLAMPKFKVMQKLIDRVNLVSREISPAFPSSGPSVARNTKRTVSTRPARRSCAPSCSPTAS